MYMSKTAQGTTRNLHIRALDRRQSVEITPSDKQCLRDNCN